MKRLLMFFLMIGTFFQTNYAQITNPTPYCACDYSNCYNMLSSVTVNTGIHNLGAMGGVGGNPVGYQYFNTFIFPNMTIGANNTITIVSYSVQDAEPRYFAIYIDINHNNTFDASEVFMQNNNTTNDVLHTFTQGDQTITKTFTIPATALAGQTRMRIVKGQNPGNLYGAYDATFTIAACKTLAGFDNSYGICYDYNVNLVSGAATAPVAAFIGTPLTGIVNATNITFTDQSSNTPTSWAWSFTPNNVAYQGTSTATSQNPVVKFTAPGVYSVSLVATNAAGNNTATHNNYITISNPPPPVAAFTTNNTNPTTNTSTVTLTDQSTNAPTSWQWTITPNTVTYQGGTSATSQNPQVIFTANGQYTVKLKATNAFGSDSVTHTNYITASPPQAPTAAFIANPTTGIVNTTVVALTDQSLHSPTAWQWTITPNNVAYQGGSSATSQSPSVKFTQAGVYTIKLKVTNAQGADSITHTNYVTINNAPPVAQFTVNNVTGNATQTIFAFTDQSTNAPTNWQWSFVPNTVTYINGTNANSQNPEVTFDNQGVYSAKLVVSNAGGLDSITKTNYITVSPGVFAPTANFVADVTHAVVNQTVVSLTDLSENLPTSWKWSITPNTFIYQDNGNSTTQNPKVIFSAAGNYTIKLKATNDLGSDSATKESYIIVTGGATAINNPQVEANILKVYPNPASGNLNFELKQGAVIKDVRIVNLEGKIVATYNHIKGNNINVSSLSNGMYFLQIEFENDIRTEFAKLSKQ